MGAVPFGASTTTTVALGLAAMLVALLGVLGGELRRGADDLALDDRAASAAAAWRTRIAFAVVVLIPVGIAASLRAASRSPAHLWEWLTIGVVLASALFAASTLHYLPVGEAPPRRAVLLLGAGAVAAAVVIVAVPAGARRAPAKTYVYRVTGTCVNHDRCGLNAHTAPYSLAPIPGHHQAFYDDDAVRIVCWRRGGLVQADHGARSDVWDKLADGRWVSDLFLTTPPPSRSPVPRCPV